MFSTERVHFGWFQNQRSKKETCLLGTEKKKKSERDVNFKK